MPIPTRKEIDAKKQEINNLYGKLSEVESGLKEEKKINERLRGDLAAKTKQLLAVEQAIIEEQTSYQWNKDSMTTRMNTIRSEGEEQIKQLDNVEGGLNIEMAEHDFLEMENERLHARLKKLATEHFQSTVMQNAEREQRKQKSFEMRATMEQILRRTLKEVDQEYMLKANDKMDKEAEWARLENVKLKKESGKRQENCATLVRQQQESYEELVQVKVETGVLQETAQKQEESSIMAREVLQDVKGRNLAMEERLDFVGLDIQALTAQLEHKRQLQVELQDLKKLLQKAESERKSICKDVVLTCRKSVQKALVVSVQDSKRKGARLTQGFSQLSGEGNGEEAGESGAARQSAEASGEQKDKDDDNHSVQSHKSAETRSTVRSTNTFLNNEAAALAQLAREGAAAEAARKAENDAEAAWNSSKSDVHVATKLRMEIRKMRKRELRELLRAEASAGYTLQQQNGKSVSTLVGQGSMASVGAGSGNAMGESLKGGSQVSGLSQSLQ